MFLNKNVVNGVSFALIAAIAGSSLLVHLPRAYADVQTYNSNQIVITSENLDEVLFANNPDAVRAMNAVMKAKDQLRIERAKLLPSLSLNLSMTIANPPMFLANSLSCLVPFLFPNAWFDRRAARAGLGAETMAFHITRLNVYSAVYALAEEFESHTQVLESMEAHEARLQEYVASLQLQSDLSVIPQYEVDRAKLDMGKFLMELSIVRQLINTERAILRKLFGFNISQVFDVQMTAVAPSKFETQSAASSLDDIVARAPERLQIDYLISQAQAQVRSAQWGFLAGCQGNQGNFSSGTGASAFTMSTGFQVNIGFGWYPRVQLAKRNVADMIFRQTELKLELGRVLEASVDNIKEIKVRNEQAEQNIAIAERMLAQQNELLPLGRASVKDMLDSYSSISTARAALLANRSALDGHRITLKRVALEDGFLKVFINSRRALELGY